MPLHPFELRSNHIVDGVPATRPGYPDPRAIDDPKEQT
jgi:hypothetical protein